MTLGKTLEKQLKREIDFALDEWDIDGYVKKLLSKKEVGEIVDSLVKEKIAQMIQDKAFLKIKSVMPIIDAYTNEKVQEFLYSLGVKV